MKRFELNTLTNDGSDDDVCMDSRCDFPKSCWGAGEPGDDISK